MPITPNDGGGPGDHPGYQFMQVVGNPDIDTGAIEALADQGYRFVAVISPSEILLARGY